MTADDKQQNYGDHSFNVTNLTDDQLDALLLENAFPKGPDARQRLQAASLFRALVREKARRYDGPIPPSADTLLSFEL